MTKYLRLLPILLVLGLFLSSCTSDTNPVNSNPAGSILVSSAPAGAQIWLDGTNQNKFTPDSITNVSVGSHTITLKLANYNDTTVSVNVVDGYKSTLNLSLTSNESVTVYGPVRLWETVGTSASQPSGLILKSGLAASVSNSAIDIYYSSTGYVVATAASFNNTYRGTAFFVGSSGNLDDGIASPLATSSWITQVGDRTATYFYLFDADSHYSKMIISNYGGGTPGNPAWVEVTWLYNDKVNDQRF